MKKNNKGFTLIELLAVIIILAIIALIAVPTIMGIIDKAKNGAAEDSAYGVISAAELWYSESLLENNGVSPAVNVEFGSSVTITKSETPNDAITSPTFDIKGTAPTGGKISISATGEIGIETELTINGKSCNFESGSTSKIKCS